MGGGIDRDVEFSSLYWRGTRIEIADFKIDCLHLLDRLKSIMLLQKYRMEWKTNSLNLLKF